MKRKLWRLRLVAIGIGGFCQVVGYLLLCNLEEIFYDVLIYSALLPWYKIDFWPGFLAGLIIGVYLYVMSLGSFAVLKKKLIAGDTIYGDKISSNENLLPLERMLVIQRLQHSQAPVSTIWFSWFLSGALFPVFFPGLWLVHWLLAILQIFSIISVFVIFVLFCSVD